MMLLEDEDNEEEVIVERREKNSFAKFFKMTADPEVVAKVLGYRFSSDRLSWVHYSEPLPWVELLRERIDTTLPYSPINSEQARREVLIAPVLLEVARYFKVTMRIEYPIVVTEQLRGTFDYLLQGQERLLVIEAKNGDLQRGFVQLVAQLAALDQWAETPKEQTMLYGVVSIGDVWRLGTLNRAEKMVTQDLSLFRVPDDLHELVPILVNLLVTPNQK